MYLRCAERKGALLAISFMTGLFRAGSKRPLGFLLTDELELELKLIQTHMTQKPVLRVELGACRFAQQRSQSYNPRI